MSLVTRLGYVYGYLDEKTNSLSYRNSIPNDGAPFDFGGQGWRSPVLFTGVSTNDKFCNFVASYNPETGQIVPNDTVAGYYFIITEGEYQNAGYYAMSLRLLHVPMLSKWIYQRKNARKR